jgi:hypothetical protein
LFVWCLCVVCVLFGVFFVFCLCFVCVLFVCVNVKCVVSNNFLCDFLYLSPSLPTFFLLAALGMNIATTKTTIITTTKITQKHQKRRRRVGG